jgi:divalent metal cation (Fe/Co/Zn/Cd) transporter
MAADAFQTTACWWLSLIAMLGLGLNAALGWWWADPLAALGMVYFLVAEGAEAWRGDDCGRDSGDR